MNTEKARAAGENRQPLLLFCRGRGKGGWRSVMNSVRGSRGRGKRLVKRCVNSDLSCIFATD